LVKCTNAGTVPRGRGTFRDDIAPRQEAMNLFLSNERT